MAYEDTPAERWKCEIDACRKRRERFVTDVWQTNVSFRVQKPFSQSSDAEADTTGSDQIAVPADWARTRSKQAALFSQLPRVSLEPARAQFMQAVPTFEKIVNFFVPKAGAASVLDECTADVVNAAGICAAVAKYEATFETVQVPSQDLSQVPPEMQQLLLQSGQVQMQPVERTVNERYRWYRISPAQLLWPIEFVGSEWQRAPWLGYDGVMPWARARDEFKLTDDDKRDCCTAPGADVSTTTLAGTIPRELQTTDEQVRFSEIFYWACLRDPEEKRYDAIRRIVFVKGKDEPVVDEPYSGQKWVEPVPGPPGQPPQAGHFIGAIRLPIEVATLTYVSDKAIPPSDSEIGRPMVLEQIRSRSQMILQRTRNLPVRTFDTNRVDPLIAETLMRGTWQGMLPTNGPGERVISQIAAAAFPKEDFSFDQVSNRDLDDAWSMSANQMAGLQAGDRSASEVQIIQNAYSSVIGHQRQKMVDMFLGLVETTMGLLQMFLDDWEAEPIVGQDGVKRLQTWDRSQIAGQYVATVRQDSSVLQDAQARLQQLTRFLNLTGKSGRINIDPILAEMAALSGLDPSQVMLPPAQPKPEPLNISYRLSGIQDLQDPISVAILMKAGQAPSPQEIEAAKLLILDAAGPPKTQRTLPFPQQGGAPGLPGAPGQLALPPGEPSRNWEAMPRVTKRPEEPGG